MKRLKTLLIGIGLGVIYAFLTMLLVQYTHKTVSIGYVFALPMIMGAIPVLLATKAQLKNYLIYIIAPWISVLTFFYLAFLSGFEGMICLIIIVGPFIVLGSLGAFIYQIAKLKSKGDNSKKLYLSLTLPLLILLVESTVTPKDYFGTVSTTVVMNTTKENVWENIKNVKQINTDEIQPHFIHKIGIPKPLNGELNHEGVGGIRSITWEKELHFKEVITQWDEGNGFNYDIVVNPNDIPPTTLDEHVMVGGKYFDAVRGSYSIQSIDEHTQAVTLTSTYRITTTLNFYGKFWTDFIFEDFHEMILEVIKGRCEAKPIVKSIEQPTYHITPVLETEITPGSNLIYCSSFEISWKKIQNEVIGDNIQLEKNIEWVDYLNQTPGNTSVSPQFISTIAGHGKEQH